MMQAAQALPIAYSMLLEGTGHPVSAVHVAFEQSLDKEQPVASDALTAEEQRAVLRAAMTAAGTDATQRAMAGAL